MGCGPLDGHLAETKTINVTATDAQVFCSFPSKICEFSKPPELSIADCNCMLGSFAQTLRTVGSKAAVNTEQ